MKKQAVVSIKSVQQYCDFDDSEPDEIALITNGSFYKKNKKYYLIYDETEYSGMGDTKTTLKIDKDIVTLIRTGASPSQMIFEENEHHVGLYNTPFGSYTIGVKTKSIENNITDLGGSLKLLYDIDLNCEKTGTNTFHIEIKTDGEY